MSYQVVEWGFPAGFGLETYGRDVDLWPDRNVDGFHAARRWPERPSGLLDVHELKTLRLRPRHALLPDAVAVRPSHRVESNSEQRLVYRCDALYRDDQAEPVRQDPTSRQVADCRNYTLSWAKRVLGDPNTVILAISQVGNFQPQGPNPAIVEAVVLDRRGRALLNTVIDPQWGSMRGQRLAPYGITSRQFRDADLFEASPLREVLAGRRVICQDRASVYGVLYAETQWAVNGSEAPNGLLDKGVGEVIDAMAASEWECARVHRSLFAGLWYMPFLRPGLVEVSPRQPAAQQALETLQQLREMRDATKVRDMTPTIRRHQASSTGTRRPLRGSVRDRSKRALVLDRSDERCENTNCPDEGYLLDRTDHGEPLLEVDHIFPLAEGGADEIFNMLAVCAGCHDRKTRGKNRMRLMRDFQAIIDAEQRRYLQRG